MKSIGEQNTAVIKIIEDLAKRDEHGRYTLELALLVQIGRACWHQGYGDGYCDSKRHAIGEVEKRLRELETNSANAPGPNLAFGINTGTLRTLRVVDPKGG